MEDEKRIIEINGIKVEVDLRYAKTVNTYKVGDPVKILIKGYGESYLSCAGMIAGFDNFQARPTLVVAYLQNQYGSDPIKFAFVNSDTKDIEICPMVDDYISIEKRTVLDNIDRKIEANKMENEDLEAKKAYFLKNFNRFFDQVKSDK